MHNDHSAMNDAQKLWSTSVPTSSTLHPTSFTPHSHSAPTHNVLKKRHSAYALSAPDRTPAPSSAPPPPPLPDVPPSRPPRNPARGTTPDISRAVGRPSTATGSREDAGPWEVEGSTPSPLPSPLPLTPRPPNSAPSIRSRASSAALNIQSTATGPVEEVTPWELYPISDSVNKSAPRAMTSSISVGSSSLGVSASVQDSSRSSHSGSSSMPNTPMPPFPPTPRNTTTATGLVEDVTPWELAPPPEDQEGEAGAVEAPSPTSPKKEKKKDKEKSREKEKGEKSKSTFSKLKSKRPVSLAPIQSSSKNLLSSYPVNAPVVAGVAHIVPPLSPSRRSLPYSDHSSLHSGSHYSLPHHMNGHSSPPPPLPSLSPVTHDATDEPKKERTPSTADTTSTHRTGQRQQPLTGPVEDVAPWEMHPPPPSAIPLNAEAPYNNIRRNRSQSSLTVPHAGLPPPLPPSPMRGAFHVKDPSRFSIGSAISSGLRSRKSSNAGLGGPPPAGKVGRDRSDSVANSLAPSVATSHSYASRPTSSRSMRTDDEGGGSREREQKKLEGSTEEDEESEAVVSDLRDFAYGAAGAGGGGLRTKSSFSTIASSSALSASNSASDILSSVQPANINPALNQSHRRQSTSNTTHNASAGQNVASTSAAAPTSIAASMSMAQMEEVTPWELYPARSTGVGKLAAPMLPGETNGDVQNDGVASSRPGTTSGSLVRPASRDGKGKERRPSRPSTSSSTTKTLADFGLRRRRSTGGKPAGLPGGPTTGAATTTPGGPVSSAGTASTASPSNAAAGMSGTSKGRESMYGAKGISNLGISFTPVPDLPLTPTPSYSTPASIAPIASTSSASSGHTHSSMKREKDKLAVQDANAKFSTADRTILEELKANIRAREAQFSVKGVGHTTVGGGRSSGKKYHPYPKGEVPYPRSYDREVLDLDVWETMFCLDICGSLTWHVFEKPPTKVLEIGCGTGTWILDCARAWKNCHFSGLDVVPLHPNLLNVGSADLASRITWVQHNFLDGLPFQNEEFDFVHIKRIALGVPEDKWDKLFEEIQRVMKPGAAFEMVEEDLFFPGKKHEEQDEIQSLDDVSALTRRNSTSSERRSSFSNGFDDSSTLAHGSEVATPTTNHSSPSTLRPASPTQARDSGIDSAERRDPQPLHKSMRPNAEPPSPPPKPVTPHSRSAARPSLNVKTVDHNHAAGPPVSLFGSSVSLLDHKRARGGSSATVGSTNDRIPQVPKSKTTPFLLRTLAAPTNPRDHSILEAIWNGMLESRFVNKSPLSLLTTFLEYHFNDVRTHPPLLYTFPPMPVKVESDDDGLSESESDLDDAIVAKPKRRMSTKSSKTPTLPPIIAPHSDEHGELSEDHRWLTMRGLVKHHSPYVSLDDTRSTAFAPVSRVQSRKTLRDTIRPTSRLPNQNFNIDLRTLNLHLALRAKEVIACSETMWEWVQEYQAKQHLSSGPAFVSRGSRYRSGSIETAHLGSDSVGGHALLDSTKVAILDLTRDDFDNLLNNFEMDMQDKACVGNALQERFDWHTFPSPPLQDRKVFNIACEKYDKWIADPKNRLSLLLKPTHRSRTSLSQAPHIPPTPEHGPLLDHHVIPKASLSTIDDSRASQPLASPSSSQMSSQSLPTQMLSRAMRVFVAWKAPAT